MDMNLAAVPAVADINFVRAFGAHLLFAEISVRGERRTGSPLTFLAGADRDGSRFPPVSTRNEPQQQLATLVIGIS